MDKQLARTLIQIFDKPTLLAMQEYINWRLENLHSRLETAGDFSTVNKLQGQIEELKTFTKIREWAIGVIENG